MTKNSRHPNTYQKPFLKCPTKFENPRHFDKHCPVARCKSLQIKCQRLDLPRLWRLAAFWMQLKNWDGLVDWLVRLCFLKPQTHHEVLGFDQLIRRNRFTDSKSQASWGCRSTNCNLWWWQSRRQIDRICKLNKQQTFHHIKLRPVISIPSKYI